MLSFGEKIAKIGPADPEIIVFRAIIKKKTKKKKITIFSDQNIFMSPACNSHLLTITGCQFPISIFLPQATTTHHTKFKNGTYNPNTAPAITKNVWQSLAW